jgi:hypothetical protein
VFRVLVPGGHYVFSVWDSHRHNPVGRIAHEVTGSFSCRSASVPERAVFIDLSPSKPDRCRFRPTSMQS